MGFNLFDKEPQQLLWADSWAACVQIIISNTPTFNGLNHFFFVFVHRVLNLQMWPRPHNKTWLAVDWTSLIYIDIFHIIWFRKRFSNISKSRYIGCAWPRL